MFQDTRRVAAKPSRRQLQLIDAKITRIYFRVANGVMIRMVDIGKVYAAGQAAALSGADMEAAIVAKVAELRLS